MDNSQRNRIADTTDFKLIAIKTLPGCNSDYYKVLSPETAYFFYNNYDIDPLTDKITHNDALPNDFFKVNNVNINVSAIVGKNGSGKSTIVELFFRTIYNLTNGQGFPDTYFQPLAEFNVALYYRTDHFYKLEVRETQVSLFTYDDFTLLPGEPLIDQIIPDFFYSIAVNYSHYAYNHKDFDEPNWFDPLFHKNDGYQTPLVINPMRTDGNIDINVENHLVVSRLIANFLLPQTDDLFSFRDVSNNLVAYKLKLTLNKGKRNKALWYGGSEIDEKKGPATISDFEDQWIEILDKLNVNYPFKWEYLGAENEDYILVIDYILYKLARICLQYRDYNRFFSKESRKFDTDLLSEFIHKLMGDHSHITFKLRQALNFLLFQNLPLEDQELTLDHLQQEMVRMDGKYPERSLQLIEIVPPPIFSIEIVLRPKSGNIKDIPLKKISSGEKQLIFSVSSLLYHLVNINSVPEGGGRVKYRYINIILEEIELYFHPELQRQYISYILQSISRIKLADIAGINFCFVTHSPFILSDIPHTNIMFLNEQGRVADKKESFKTFGANIHDLMKQSFFLEKGTMGEFAKNKIQATINYLNLKRIEQEIIEIEKRPASSDADLLTAKRNELELQRKLVRSTNIAEHKSLIKIIDEPILKQKLSQMFDEYHQTDLQLDIIEEKIKLLTEEASRIRKGK
ncbi:AAA family ATPase [Pedobacter jeongneungensis]|uniref:AAA family ATPase n=1 Tax=Pedobacter jeongneungensis TaxID=947309 RepID=UPI000469FED8|nr:AAA family ATPase [Pedobacter jeongneungensis]